MGDKPTLYENLFTGIGGKAMSSKSQCKQIKLEALYIPPTSRLSHYRTCVNHLFEVLGRARQHPMKRFFHFAL